MLQKLVSFMSNPETKLPNLDIYFNNPIMTQNKISLICAFSLDTTVVNVFKKEWQES